MGLIIEQFEIFVDKIKQVIDVRINRKCGQGERRSGELLFNLVHMIGIEVSIAKGVHKIAGLKTSDLSNHQCEYGIGGNIKRHPQKHIRTALVKLTGQAPLGDVELK